MKRNEIKQLAEKTVTELNKSLESLVKELAQVRLEKKVGKLQDVRKASKISDDIARIKTVLRQKVQE